jgi:predicted dehydrogenase
MIRLAIVGAKAAGQYARVAWRFADVAFVAIAGIGPDIDANAERLGAGIVCDGIDKLLEQHGAEFDAVLVHGSSSREANGLIAAEAAKHVLVEAPWTTSSLVIESLCEAHERIGMEARPWRLLPSVASVKQQLVEGKLGQLGLIRLHCWDSSGAAGSIVERMAGQLDLACWLFDRAPTEIYGHGLPTGNPDNEHGYAQLHLGFSDGGMAVLDHWRTLPRGDDYFSLTAIGSSGAAYADDHHNMQLVYRGGRPEASRISQSDFAVAAQLRAFLDAIAAGSSPQINDIALREVIVAASESIRQREVVAC